MRSRLSAFNKTRRQLFLNKQHKRLTFSVLTKQEADIFLFNKTRSRLFPFLSKQVANFSVFNKTKKQTLNKNKKLTFLICCKQHMDLVCLLHTGIDNLNPVRKLLTQLQQRTWDRTHRFLLEGRSDQSHKERDSQLVSAVSLFSAGPAAKEERLPRYPSPYGKY